MSERGRRDASSWAGAPQQTGENPNLVMLKGPHSCVLTPSVLTAENLACGCSRGKPGPGWKRENETRMWDGEAPRMKEGTPAAWKRPTCLANWSLNADGVEHPELREV